jgi:hypothetical protein
MNNDQKTTIIGAAAAIIQAANVNFAGVIQGDRAEIGKLLVAILTAVWAYFTNRKNAPAPPAP